MIFNRREFTHCTTNNRTFVPFNEVDGPCTSLRSFFRVVYAYQRENGTPHILLEFLTRKISVIDGNESLTRPLRLLLPYHRYQTEEGLTCSAELNSGFVLKGRVSISADSPRGIPRRCPARIPSHVRPDACGSR